MTCSAGFSRDPVGTGQLAFLFPDACRAVGPTLGSALAQHRLVPGLGRGKPRPYIGDIQGEIGVNPKSELG
jgi:hypothetical protein